MGEWNYNYFSAGNKLNIYCIFGDKLHKKIYTKPEYKK